MRFVLGAWPAEWLGYSLENVSFCWINLPWLVVDDAAWCGKHLPNRKGKKPIRGLRARDGLPSFVRSLGPVHPIFFMPGVIGLLFHEFAVVVSLAVLVSAIVSLTLVPMLASRFLPADSREHNDSDPSHGEKTFIGRHFEAGFTALRNGYVHLLDKALAHRTWAVVAVCTLR